ncbi:MAG TPA: Hpt domain-containing protein [Burkholderiaceae bacterium]
MQHNTFRLEVAAHLSAMRTLVDALERRQFDGDIATPLQDLIRELHSLKGEAGAVEHGKLEYLCRSLEQVLFRVLGDEIRFFPLFFGMFH